MAEGAIRIVPESNQNANGETGSDDEFHVLSDAELRELDGGSSNNGTPRKSAKDRRREKRASVRVTDRGNEDTEVNSEPDRRTPPPRRKTTAPTVAKYMSESESLTNARFYLAMIEYMGVRIAGGSADAEMTEFERMAMTPALQRSLRRIPISMLEKGNVILDSVLLGGGLFMYFARISPRVKLPSRNVKKGVQEDISSPVSQPMETVVVNTKPGDIDGIAVPVPDVFKQYMDGAI
jgi:hypothetical protein